MKRLLLMSGFALNLTLVFAAPGAIGTVTASGAFRVNGDTVMSNGTLTEGAVLETGNSNSAVRMAGGARLLFTPDSRGKVFRDRFILDKGETRLENGAGFHLDANGLTIRPDDGASAAWIALVGSNRVRVAALTGGFRVENTSGGLVAKVTAGSALAFEPLAPASAGVTRLTGILVERNGQFQLTDQVTHVTANITGLGLSVHAGRMVQVSGILNAGAAPAAGASQVIDATQVQTIATTGATNLAVVRGVMAEASGSSPSIPLAVPVGPPPTPPGQPPGRPPVTPPVTPPGQPPGRPPVTPPPLSR